MRGFVGTAHCISKMTREQNGQTRVEFAVRLPAADGEALLPIDSKFPQEDHPTHP